MGRDEFVPKIKPGSKAVSGEMIVPIIFFLYDRLEQAIKEMLRSTRSVIRKVPLKRLYLVCTRI